MEDIIKLNDKNFKIITLLGKGKGGYSYLVTNEKKEYCLKQIHHEPCSYYNFGNKIEAEIRDYNTLSTLNLPLPKMLFVDREKEIILKDYIQGPTIMELIKHGMNVEEYIPQVKEMCSVLYNNNLNIDYFPTNFVLNDNKLWYIDYECNTFDAKWSFESWGIKYWTDTKERRDYLENN